jgi:putative transcriptional regulator
VIFVERYRLKADGRIVAIDSAGREVSPPMAGGEQSASYARRVRSSTGLSQTAFAASIGIPVDTLRNWEQGKRAPRGPARALLKIIARSSGL